MSSRTTRLLTLLDGTDAAKLLAAELGSLRGEDVDLIIRALRVARRTGREDERDLRKRQRSDRQRHGRKDDDQIAYAASSIAKSLANRAGYTLETLSMLKAHYDDGPRMLALAVAGARAQGYSDTDIGRALSVTPQAIGERYGRRTARVVPDTRPAGNEIQPQDQLAKLDGCTCGGIGSTGSHRPSCPWAQQYVTRTGKVLTDDDVQALADEAERGYDVHAHTVDGPPDCRRCQLLRDNAHWMAVARGLIRNPEKGLSE